MRTRRIVGGGWFAVVYYMLTSKFLLRYFSRLLDVKLQFILASSRLAFIHLNLKAHLFSPSGVPLLIAGKELWTRKRFPVITGFPELLSTTGGS